MHIPSLASVLSCFFVLIRRRIFATLVLLKVNIWMTVTGNFSHFVGWKAVRISFVLTNLMPLFQYGDVRELGKRYIIGRLWKYCTMNRKKNMVSGVTLHICKSSLESHKAIYNTQILTHSNNQSHHLSRHISIHSDLVT